MSIRPTAAGGGREVSGQVWRKQRNDEPDVEIASDFRQRSFFCVFGVRMQMLK